MPFQWTIIQRKAVSQISIRRLGFWCNTFYITRRLRGKKRGTPWPKSSCRSGSQESSMPMRQEELCVTGTTRIQVPSILVKLVTVSLTYIWGEPERLPTIIPTWHPQPIPPYATPLSPVPSHTFHPSPPTRQPHYIPLPYIYIHTYIYIFGYICAHTYFGILVCICMHTFVFVCACVYAVGTASLDTYRVRDFGHSRMGGVGSCVESGVTIHMHTIWTPIHTLWTPMIQCWVGFLLIRKKVKLGNNWWHQQKITWCMCADSRGTSNLLAYQCQIETGESVRAREHTSERKRARVQVGCLFTRQRASRTYPNTESPKNIALEQKAKRPQTYCPYAQSL